MLNKKLLIATFVASVLSFNAFAKTEGNYVGLNLINTHGKNTLNDYDKNTNPRGTTYETHRDNAYSFGVDYKYALNFNNFFVAPGVFYDHNSMTDKVTFQDDAQGVAAFSLKYTYGTKVDFGYDVTDAISPFVTVGYAINHNTAASHTFGGKKHNKDESLVYGLGLRYNVTKAISVNAAYELFQNRLNRNYNDFFNGTDKANASYKVAKLGVAYNF